MSSKRSTTIPSSTLTPEEMGAILRFLFFIRKPAMKAQLISTVLANQASAQDLRDALGLLTQVMPVNMFQTNLEALVANAPALEIVCRHARNTESDRPWVFPQSTRVGVKFIPEETVIQKLFGVFAAETDQEFEEQLRHPTR